jgi:hypothetical protein
MADGIKVKKTRQLELDTRYFYIDQVGLGVEPIQVERNHPKLKAALKKLQPKQEVRILVPTVRDGKPTLLTMFSDEEKLTVAETLAAMKDQQLVITKEDIMNAITHLINTAFISTNCQAISITTVFADENDENVGGMTAINPAYDMDEARLGFIHRVVRNHADMLGDKVEASVGPDSPLVAPGDAAFEHIKQGLKLK